jgi:hypothetical protein
LLDEKGAILRAKDQVAVGDSIRARLAFGDLTATVTRLCLKKTIDPPKAMG